MSLHCEIPMTLPSVANGNKGGHWAVRARRTKTQRLTIGLLLRANRIGDRLEPLKRGEVLVVRLARTSPRKLDDDNLAYAFKAIRDEVAAFFHVPDNHPSIRFEYAQAAGKPSSVRIDFAVEPPRAVLAKVAAVSVNAAQTERAIAAQLTALEET